MATDLVDGLVRCPRALQQVFQRRRFARQPALHCPRRLLLLRHGFQLHLSHVRLKLTVVLQDATQLRDLRLELLG
jgi:hypothetical protein